jgi:zinc transport system substrate-binding protein
MGKKCLTPGFHGRALAAVVATLALTACGGDEPTAPPPPRTERAVPEVWTTFYPTTYFTERIAGRLGGGLVKVVCPLPPEEDPAFWSPDTAVLQGYQAADLVVVNGAHFEAWVDTSSLPASRVLSVSAGFADRWIKLEGSTTHSHGPAGAHTHAGIDGHTWVDPLNAKAQADAIRRALLSLLPAKQAAIDANFAALARDLDLLDVEFERLGKLPEGTSLYASHPAWNYLAQRYEWSMVGLLLEPEEPLLGEAFAQVKASLATKPGTHLLWEDAPLPATAERLQRELGLTSLVVPPCETESTEDRAAGRDWLQRMQANVETLRAAFPPK